MLSEIERPSRLEELRVSYRVVRGVISDQIVQRRPCSIVRIGDGESVILNWPATADSVELRDHLNMWFGTEQLSDRSLGWLKGRLTKACVNAGILGVPTVRQVKLHPRYRSSYECIDSLFKRRLPRGNLICDAAVHRLLQLSGDLGAVLYQADFLGLVTSKSVGTAVQKCLKPRILSQYQIPIERSESKSVKDGEFQWLPKGYRELRRALHVPYKGATFLVGGGLMGKLICEDIRRKGGIAIDIGSVFDGWVLENTRAYFDRYPQEMYTLEFCTSQAGKNDESRVRSLLENLKAFEEHPSSLKI